MSGELRLRRDDLAWRAVEDELIAIDVRDSSYLSANDSGLLLWRTLAEGTTREGLVAALTEQFDVDPATAGADVDAFLADLRERGLLDEAVSAD